MDLFPERLALLNPVTSDSCDMVHLSGHIESGPVSQKHPFRYVTRTYVHECHFLAGVRFSPSVRGHAEVLVDGVSVLEMPIAELALAHDPDKLPWKNAKNQLFLAAPIQDRYCLDLPQIGFFLPNCSTVEIRVMEIPNEKLTAELHLGLYGMDKLPKGGML